MRRMSIEEVRLQLEHVLLMPIETLQTLIITFVISGFISLAILWNVI